MSGGCRAGGGRHCAYTTRLALANLPKTVATCSTSFATNSHFLTGEAPGATQVLDLCVQHNGRYCILCPHL